MHFCNVNQVAVLRMCKEEPISRNLQMLYYNTEIKLIKLLYLDKCSNCNGPQRERRYRVADERRWCEQPA